VNKELIEKIIAYNYNEYGSEFGDALVDLKHENEWLHHIIKEVREYIQDRYDGEVLTHTFDKDNVGELLEILDKAGDEISK